MSEDRTDQAQPSERFTRHGPDARSPPGAGPAPSRRLWMNSRVVDNWATDDLRVRILSVPGTRLESGGRSPTPSAIHRPQILHDTPAELDLHRFSTCREPPR